MTSPTRDHNEAGQDRPDWLPPGISVVDHVRNAARQAGPPPELDDPDTDWDWDPDHLISEGLRVGCIPHEDHQRALGQRGEDKPQWFMELQAASGDSLYISNRPQITMAAASGQLGERAQRTYEDLAAKGLIKHSAEGRPKHKPQQARPSPSTADHRSEALPKATWQRVGQKTAEIALTTTTTRRYRAEGETLDQILAAAASTGRLSDPKRLAATPVDDDIETGTLPDGRRHAVKQDGTAAAAATPKGAKTAEITLIATTTRRYLATDTQAIALCAAAEALGALHDRPRMLPNHTPEQAEPAAQQPEPPANGIDVGF